MPTPVRGATRWSVLVLAALLCLLLAPHAGSGFAPSTARAQDAPAPSGATITAPEGGTVLLRAAPGYGAPVLAALPAGTPLESLAGPVPAADGTDWTEVTAAGQTGYVPAAAVAASTTSPAVTDPAPATTATDLPPGPASDPITPPPAAPDEPTAAAAPAVSGAAAPATGNAATTTAEVDLRAGPSAADPVLLPLPAGAAVTLAGPATAGFLPVVTADGTFGWLDAASLATSDPSETLLPSSLPPPSAGAVSTTGALNLRVSPADTAPVLLVLPPGAPLQTVGPPENGFSPVSYEGQIGWAAAAYLAPTDPISPTVTDAPPVPDPAPAPSVPSVPSGTSSPSSGIAWPMSGGSWTVIQGYNNGTHTNRGPQADYRYSLDLALGSGDTAGQPVYAPVSGTVRWVDPGSGGILIDAGNGSGVAMFHLTLDGGLGSGQPIAQGQPLGVVSGPGGPGYAGTPHIDLTLWQLTDGANVSTPFSGPNAIAGQDFPADGSPNQHYGAEIAP